VVKFKVSNDGSIELRDLANDALLKGKKIESYPNFFKEGKADPVSSAAGRYEGMMYIGKDFAKKMTLTVTSFNGYTVAGMTDDNVTITFELNVGTAGTDSVLYLTTGNTGRPNWVQLRGLLKNGEFRGRTIIGGRGLSARDFVLKKIVK